MVEEQIIRRGIRDEKVIDAFLTVPRPLFIPPEYRRWAYQDSPVSIGEGQTISQPYIVALMTILLDLRETDRVLEIGTGSGYQTAICAKCAEEIFTIERIQTLSDRAQDVFQKMGLPNVYCFVGDGSKGLPAYAPYDRIIVTACSDTIYQAWIDDLKEGGVIVLPLGREMMQSLIRGVKKRGRIVTENHGGCVFVPLIPDRFSP